MDEKNFRKFVITRDMGSRASSPAYNKKRAPTARSNVGARLIAPNAGGDACDPRVKRKGVMFCEHYALFFPPKATSS